MAKLGDGEEKYVEDSVEFICDGDKLSDLSAVIDHGCLTVAQCALIFPACSLKGKKNKQDTLSTYLLLVLEDIKAGKLNPKHPDSLLPYSAYLKMCASGMYGEHGERMPLPTADWLITLDDAEKWLISHGIQFNFDGMRADAAKYTNPPIDVHAEPAPKLAVSDWREEARMIALEYIKKHQRNNLFPSQRDVCEKVADVMRERKIYGAQGKPLEPSYIQRNAISGTWWQQNKP